MLRSYFIIQFGWFGVDSFRNLLYAQQIRQSKHRILKCERVPFDSDHYLPGLPWILSWFPPRTHKNLQFASPLFDILNLVLMLGFGSVFLHLSQAQLFFAAVFYVLMPLLIYQSCSLNARPVANLIFSIAVLAQIIFLRDGGGIFFLVSIIFAAGLPFLNRVSVQSYVAFVIGLSAFYSTIWPILSILLSFLICALIVPPYGLNLLKEHVKLTRYFFRRGSIYEGVLKITSPRLLIVWMPSVLFLLVAPFCDVPLILLVWSWSILLISLFWIGGRGHFHLTNSAIPLSLLSGSITVEILAEIGIDSYLSLYLISALFCLFVIALYVSPQIKTYFRKNYDTYILCSRLDSIYTELSNLSPNGYILPIPGRLGLSILYRTNSKVLIGLGSGLESIKHDLKNLLPYKFSNLELSQIINKFSVRMLLVHTSFINIESLKTLENSGGLNIIKSAGNYILYSISDKLEKELTQDTLLQICLNKYKPIGY